MIKRKRLDITELLAISNSFISKLCKKHLDFFGTSHMIDFSDEVPVLLGRD